MARIVVALGGNAILKPKQIGTIEEQIENVSLTANQIAEMVFRGYEVIVTHGNGPQVGNILLQNEEAYKAAGIPAMPLDVCGSQSQGLIGYIIQRCLGNELRKRQIKRDVVTLVTQVLVSLDDPAFENPTKPIGPFYTPARAERLRQQRGYVMKEDASRGYRRVVPSPDPKAIVEREAIRRLVDDGVVVIASGGGGIPVVHSDSGMLRGVEAVIDKDLAGQRLALDLGADTFLILTDVERVALDYARPGQRFIDKATTSEMREWQAQGHFSPGSMGPKVTAAIRFVESGGSRAIITSLDQAIAALDGAGTHITSS